MAQEGRLTRDEHSLLVVFTAGLALAAWTHLMGNTRGDPDPAHLLLLGGAVMALARPARPLGLTVLGVGVLATAWDEAPQLSNHWTLTAMFAVSLLVVLASAMFVAWRTDGGAAERLDLVQVGLARWFIPTVRWTFLAFYLWASFDKLNSSFFDPAVSCAVVFLDESLTSIGVGSLGVADQSFVQWAVIFGTTIVELIIPWLLMLRRTRVWGVVLAIAFHAVLSIDKSHQIVDFSSLLTVIYLSFLPVGFFTRVLDRGKSLTESAAERLNLRTQTIRGGVVAFVAVTGLAAELSVPRFDSSRSLLWWLWQPTIVAVIVVVARYVHRQPDGSATPLGRPPAWLMVIPILAFANGTLPYLEVRTAGSWNMYANLSVVDGNSNHFVIRWGLPLTEEHRDLVEIMGSSDPGLEQYALQGLAITRTQLRSYVADHPDVAITYRHQGRVTETARAGDDPLLNQPVSVWREKFQVFRPVSMEGAEKCLALWGVAR
ncbi:MAG: HTTM domain-containing protein [Microthrixaceae bacterium]|jgi:hypothetical protein|nr:HTTM domain-containing protein [Microthrixaceae bacterium]